MILICVINNPDEVENFIKDNDIENENDDNQKKSKNAINFNYQVNDEIYPGEIFNLQLFNDNKPKCIYDNKNILSNNININNVHEYLSEPVYINNLNIIGNLNTNNNSQEKKELEEKIKKLENELNSKKNFKNLEISSSESTLEIDSSYENINIIANNQFITNHYLRDATKEFIRNKIFNHDKIINFNTTFKKRKRKSCVSNEDENSLTFDKIFNKKKTINRSQSLALSNNSSNKSNGKLKDKNKSNRLMAQKFLKSIVSTNQISQVETFKSKIKNFDLSVSTLKHPKRSSVQHSPKNEEKLFGTKKKSITFMEEEEEKGKEKEKESINKKRRNKTSDKNYLHLNAKKKKKKNELDIITLNIQKSSQNLNQPDIFYAGLFSQLLFKGTSSENVNKNINNNDKDDINKIDDNNSENISDDIDD